MNNKVFSGTANLIELKLRMTNQVGDHDLCEPLVIFRVDQDLWEPLVIFRVVLNLQMKTILFYVLCSFSVIACK
jgi:hypothetical protein